MPYSHYPHGFSHGVSIKNVPVDITASSSANVFWVNSETGSNQNRGTFLRPFATLAYAISQCTNSQGDKIYVSAGHVETVDSASAVTVNVAGITIEFLGEGANRATLNFTTSIAASIVISASNVTIINPYCVCNKDALTSPITITGSNCKIVNGEWHDRAGLAATNVIVASSAATALKIYGWKFYASTTGTQKLTHIQANGIADLELKDIEIFGDFATGNINNVGTALTNLILDGVKLKNTNATPKPGMVIQAATTGQAKNVDIRIASGTTYVSSVAAINWDYNCLGYNADGKTGDLIGVAGSGSIETLINDIQADIGDPSARTNEQSLEAMIGIPDAANSSLGEMIYTGFDSSAVVPGANGSVMERLEVIQAALASPQGDFYKVGTCDAGMVDSKTSIVAADLAGFGDDFFNVKYYMQVIRNDNSHGAAPEVEIRQITDYTSTTGTFVVNAFSANVQALDRVAIIHQSLISGTSTAGTIVDTLNTNLGNPAGDTLTSITAKLGNGATTVTADLGTIKTNLGDASGDTLTSVVAKLGNGATTTTADLTTLKTNVGDPSGHTLTSLTAKIGDNAIALGTTLGTCNTDTITSIAGKLGNGATTMAADFTTLKTNVGDPSGDTLTSLTAKLGNGATTMAADFTTLKTNLGDPSGDTLTSITAKLGDGATTVTADLTTIKTEVAKIDSASLAVSPVAGSIGRFIASGGTALGTQLADSKSLIDAIGSNGTTLVYGSGSILGAKGTSFWIKKTMVSSAIVSGAPVDITSVSSGGELAVEDVIVKTDGTGLATGTNFELKTDNARGQLNFFVETVANLGASVTVNLDAASVTGERTILESGKKFQVQSTVLDCTGGGEIDIYIKLRRIDAGATVAAL